MALNSRFESTALSLHVSIAFLVRRLRQVSVEHDLSLAELSALSRLDRNGVMSSGELAKMEQITPQSMGVTLSSLETRGFVTRQSDAADGRRVVVSVAEPGLEVLRKKRSARTRQLANALERGFTETEIDVLEAAAPLIERLAQMI